MSRSKFKSFLRDYFTLTSRERRGAFVLSLIIFLQLATIIWKNYTRSPPSILLEPHAMKLYQFEKEMQNIDSITEKKWDADFQKRAIPTAELPLTKFNPNTITDAQWMAMGLSQKQVRIIRNYLHKGGSFESKETLSKIYGISSEMYLKLAPYISIPEDLSDKKEHFKNKPKSKKVITQINLNNADTIQLAELPLVGPGRARMIYKYREALGGFYDLNQLLEVFTIDSVTLKEIAPFLFIDTLLIHKININSELIKHPYLSKQTSRIIQSYRKQHGAIRGIKELEIITQIDHEMYSKLVPYVAFE
ncbi:MAG: helix-hairpin-helix domain-containing protein [Bacteroidetes bacterium]|nr:helix-hairpin-helix domain-containing protein [Bacteroidota bacterium]